jgi:1-acyl-sn-glycerol-3-phosphate acyltransferase
MRGMKHIPVDREAGQGSFDAALAALRSGEIIGVFPEATISRSFEIKAFKSGAVRLAQGAGVPVLPVTIWGSQRVWTKGQPKRMGRHHVPLLITVGAPIVVGPDENANDATARIRAAMDAQLRQDQERYPAWPDAEKHLLPVRLGGTAPTLEEADALDKAERQRRRAKR